MNARVVSKDLMYEGRICRAWKVRLEMDDGEVVPRDLIEYHDAVVVVPVRDDGALVLIRNERFAVGEELLEFPTGMLEDGEEPCACAARELAEETGYSARRLERLGGFYSCPGSTTEYLHVFLAEGLSRGRQALEAHERIRVEVVPAGAVGEMIASGQLHDAKSIAAYTLWRLKAGGPAGGADESAREAGEA